MATTHHISHADEIYLGGVYYAAARAGHGVRQVQLFTHQLGAVVAADADGVLVGGTATATGGTSFTLATGAALVSVAGTAQMDVPRNIVISSAATGGATSATGVNFTITGTDVYGETISEVIAGFSTGAAGAGAKAFYTVTAAAASAAVTDAVNIGTGNVLGMPIKMADKGAVIAYSVDGLPTTPTIVVGLATGTPSTTTTADVRGTITTATGVKPNGTRRYTALIAVPSNRRKIDVYGNTQA